jgi:GTPase SAR1 family protein
MEGASEYNSKDSATKIVVLGQGTVGKSSLTLRFTMNAFAEDYVPTVQDTYRKNFMLEDEMAQLGIHHFYFFKKMCYSNIKAIFGFIFSKLAIFFHF